MEIRINSVRQDRIYLILSGCADHGGMPGLFVLFDEKGKGAAYVRHRNTGENTFDLCINIEDAGSGAALPPGKYRLACVYPEKVFAAGGSGFAPYGLALEYGRKGYCLTADVAADADHVVCLEVRDTGAGRKNPAKTAAKEAAFLSWYRLARMKHDSSRGKTNVLFFTEQSDTLTENLRILKEELEKKDTDGRFRIMTSARMAVTDRHLGMQSWLGMLTKLAEADYIFMDDHAPVLDRIRLDAGTVITQVWHGGLGFKATGYARCGRPGGAPPVSCHRQYTWGIAPGRALVPVFAEMWGIPECRVLPFGMPRLREIPDAAGRAKRKADLLARYPGLAGRKILLFAPTYRGGNIKSAGYPYEKIDFDRLSAFAGEEYAVVFKMHPWVTEKVPVGGRSNLFDLSAENNMDLFSAADLMITDYSSNIYEFSLFGKPMLFYAFDAEAYEESRGFHLDYSTSAPGKVTKTFEELLDALKTGDFEEEKADAYRRKAFDPDCGDSAGRILDGVLFGKMPEEITENVRRHDRRMRLIYGLCAEDVRMPRKE